MAFCARCGRELGPNEVCSCQNETGAEEGRLTAFKQKITSIWKNKQLILGVAGVFVTLVAVIVVFSIVRAGSYKKPIKGLVKLINGRSTDLFEYEKQIMPPMDYDMLVESYKILKNGEEYKDRFENARESLSDFYEDYKGFKITKYDFVKAKEMKKSELRSIEKNYTGRKDDYEDLIEEIRDMDRDDYEDLAEELDISVSAAKKFVKLVADYAKECTKVKVTKGYEVELRFYAKYDGETDKTERITVRIIQMNGGWYLCDASELFYGIRFKDDLSDIRMYDIYRAFYSSGISWW